VLPSTSVNKKVTVPTGRSGGTWLRLRAARPGVAFFRRPPRSALVTLVRPPARRSR